MNRQTVIAAVGGIVVFGIAAWFASRPVATTYWSWQSGRSTAFNDATWQGCTDPGASVMFGAIAQDAEIPCSADLWLPWLEEDLGHLGARVWADAVRDSPDATATQRLRLALARTRRGSKWRSVEAPELAALVQAPGVPVSERDWVYRWLLSLDVRPPWVDPVLSETLVALSFVQDDTEGPDEWLVWLGHALAAPGSTPPEVLGAAVEHASRLLDSAAPVEVDRPLCAEPVVDCLESLYEVGLYSVRADAFAWDGGPEGQASLPEVIPVSLSTPLWQALYGGRAVRIDNAEWWVRGLSDWLLTHDEIDADDLQRVLANPLSTTWGAQVPRSEWGDPAAVLGRRSGTPWGTALAALAVAARTQIPVTVSETSQGVVLQLEGQSFSVGVCGPLHGSDTGRVVSEREVLAGAAIEALAGALGSADEARASRLAGLAERTHPDRYTGLVRAVSSAPDGPAAMLGHRLGRAGTSTLFDAWVAEARSLTDEACVPSLPATAQAPG